jgi:hypothetical protein
VAGEGNIRRSCPITHWWRNAWVFSSPHNPGFDVELADGGRAIPLAYDELMHRLEEVTDRPVLSQFGGGGDETQLDRHYWLTPHPRTVIRLLFSWPSQHLAPATTTIHADALQNATAAALQLWPWGPVEDMERDDLDRRH